jgi:hypothetical protein
LCPRDAAVVEQDRRHGEPTESIEPAPVGQLNAAAAVRATTARAGADPAAKLESALAELFG